VSRLRPTTSATYSRLTPKALATMPEREFLALDPARVALVSAEVNEAHRIRLEAILRRRATSPPTSSPSSAEVPSAEVTSAKPEVWLERASDLLREPDPGPTPHLVDELLVDTSMFAIVGSWKVAKTWAVLEMCRAIVSGAPAFGRYAVSEPGPVIVALEESGRAALHRRLDALVRGNAQSADELEELWFAANLRIKLDEPGWQERLLEAGRALHPRAVFFDPLVRMKGASRNENEQLEMGPVLEFQRRLRDEIEAAVGFVHHAGHDGQRMRGSSDLEAFWESKLTIAKDGEGFRLVTPEHREAESPLGFRFRLAWEGDTRSMRLVADTDPRVQKIAELLDRDPEASANEIFKDIGGNRPEVLKLVAEEKERRAHVVEGGS